MLFTHIVGTSCYYFTSDTFLILAENQINAAKQEIAAENGETVEIVMQQDAVYEEIKKEQAEKLKLPKWRSNTLKHKLLQVAKSDDNPTNNKLNQNNKQDITALEKEVEKWKLKADQEKVKRVEIGKKLEEMAKFFKENE